MGEPSTHAGSTGELRTGLHECYPRTMVDRFGVHGIHDAHVVRDFRGVGKKLADPLPALSVLGKLEGRTDEWQACLISRHSGQALSLADGVGQFLAGFLFKLRPLGIETVLRGASGAKLINHSLGLGGMVQPISRFRMQHIG